MNVWKVVYKSQALKYQMGENLRTYNDLLHTSSVRMKSSFNAKLYRMYERKLHILWNYKSCRDIFKYNLHNSKIWYMKTTEPKFWVMISTWYIVFNNSKKMSKRYENSSFDQNGSFFCQSTRPLVFLFHLLFKIVVITFKKYVHHLNLFYRLNGLSFQILNSLHE